MQKKDKNIKKIQESLSRLKGYVGCIESVSNEKMMLKWFEKIIYLELQEGKRIPELSVIKGILSQGYIIIDKTIKTAEFNFKVKSGELEAIIRRENEVVEIYFKNIK